MRALTVTFIMLLVSNVSNAGCKSFYKQKLEIVILMPLPQQRPSHFFQATAAAAGIMAA